MSKKRRSILWVVSTHVLTTGVAVPVLTMILCAALISAANIRDPSVALYLVATGTVLGYAGGTLYSLAYLRKTADCERWTSCTKPSILTFALLDMLACAWNVSELPERTAVSMGILMVSCLVSVVAFAVLTSAGFARMSPAGSPIPDTPGSLEAAGSSSSVKPGTSMLRKRLLGACVGFAAGFAVGLGISIYMDHGGGTGWQTRIVTGFVVGGIGALLGLISGVPQV